MPNHPATSDRERFRAHAALIAVQVCFGLFPVFGKLAFRPGGFSPFAVGAWRMAFGAVALLALALGLHGRAFWDVRRDLPQLLLASVLGVTANMLLYLEGLSRSSANEATLVMCLIPVFTFGIAALFGQEAWRPLRAVGILVALVGVSALFWAQQRSVAREHLPGNLLMVLNTLCYAAYFVWARPLVRRHPPLVVIAWVFVLSLPAAAWIASRETMVPAGADARAWGSLAFILVFPTVVAYLLNLFALARVSASTTAVFIYSQPVVTVLSSAALLGEPPTGGLLVACALVFLGIRLVARPAARTAPAAALHGDSARP
jgi:drug/metabolite transporter (DMT)-like permease